VSAQGGVDATYVLPLRWTEPGPHEELAGYLAGLDLAETIVVDGSPPDVFARHAAALDGVATHVKPAPGLRFLMGKVNGVVTGIRLATRPHVVIADDDVRYSPAALRRAVALLAEADLVRPQNYFEPLSWHARWDTARSLLNRVFSGDPAQPAADFPGTLALRREAFLAAGGYDGDVMFENLELIRTIRAVGGRELAPLDLYVARRPPTARHFLSQRVRQAYDDFALPLRLGFFLSLAPAAFLGRRQPAALGAAAAAIAGVAEVGRRRAGGTAVFPATASLMAPLWLAERAVCSWLAVARRLTGGVRYGESRIPRAATPARRLRRRYAPGPRASAERKPVSL